MTIHPSMARMSGTSQTPTASTASVTGVKPTPPLSVVPRSSTNKGTLGNWTPKFLLKDNMGKSREAIVKRAMDLAESDPNVAGLIEGMTISTIGCGLRAQSKIRRDVVGLKRKKVKRLQAAMEWEFALFSKSCCIKDSMQLPDIESVLDRSMLLRGEYLVLVKRKKGSNRHGIKLQILDPLKMKTPSDLMKSDRVIDGVEIDADGKPIAVWIHNNPKRPYELHSKNFKRIKIWKGHRRQVLHGFIQTDPEQYRGKTFFSPALKFFRDLSDLLDAEVVSNIVTSAAAMFIATPHPDAAAMAAAGGANGYAKLTEGRGDRDDVQGVSPGGVIYGRPGEEPHILDHNRPGNNFVPFIDLVLRSAAMTAGIPLEVAQKKFGEMTYATARAALNEAYKVFGYRQDWIGRHALAPLWEMVQESAYLQDFFDVPDFYTHFDAYTRCNWIPPKRDRLEPVKEVQADIMELKYEMTTQENIAARKGQDWEQDIAHGRRDEKDIEKECGLDYALAIGNNNTTGAGKENAK